MVAVVVSAVYVALMLSIFDELTLLLTLPVGGFLLFARLGKSGINGSTLGGLLTALAMILWAALFKRDSYTSSIHRLHLITSTLAICGGLGLLVGFVADYLSWLLIGSRTGRQGDASQAGSLQEEPCDGRDSR